MTAAVLMASTGVLFANSASAAPATGPSTTPTAVGSVPAVPKTAKVVGALADTSSISATVTLKPADPAALEAYATAVSTPGNALYRQHLSTAQFASKFGPSDATIAAVQQVLTDDGLSPDAISANHLAIQIHGSTATFAKAFSTQFKQYRLATGRVAYANTSAPKLSSSVASSVEAVIGLNNLVLAHPQSITKAKSSAAAASQTAAPHVVTGGPQACAAAVAVAPTKGAYTADQIANAYKFNGFYGAGNLGQGQTIAMYELESNSTADIAAYQACYGTSTSVSYIKVGPGSGTGPGSGEAALDIENAISIAPKATQLVYQGQNGGSGTYDTFNAIISQNKATIISTSWGICELNTDAPTVAAENTLFQEAAVQGQSLFDAAGDNGSQDCGDGDTRLSADDPGGQPFVTVVGGTTLTNVAAATPTEVLWNEKANGSGAGGAGISKFFKMPAYQSTAAASLHVVNANSNGAVCGAAAGSFCRQEPDVSLVADPLTGFLVYYDGAWTGIGGTSGAAPIWAAYTALINASSTCAGSNVGFVNPALYSIAGRNFTANFTDITSGNSDYTGTAGGLYPTAVGYDIASGLGTPKGTTLAYSLCGGSTAAGAYQPLTPARILDTRLGAGAKTIPAKGTITLTVAGHGGVPGPAGLPGLPLTQPTSANINFTVTNAGTAGYLTAYPTGSPRPSTSNLNFTAGANVANTTIAKLGTGGSITVFNGSTKPVDLVGDVAGYYLTGLTPAAAGSYQPLATQTRLLDTRTLGAAGKLAAGKVRYVTVANTAGVPAGVASVVLNVTSTNASNAGHLRVFAAGSRIPFASNVNFTRARTVANEVVVAPAADGRVAIYNGGKSGTTDVVVDVIGYVTGGATLPGASGGLQKAVTPLRVLDTRNKIGTPTVAKVPAMGFRVVQIAGIDGVPLDARSAVVTVTATNENNTGYATVYPGRNRPVASILNFLVKTDVANIMIAPIGPNGTITIFNGSNGATDLIIDLAAYTTGPTVG